MMRGLAVGVVLVGGVAALIALSRWTPPPMPRPPSPEQRLRDEPLPPELERLRAVAQPKLPPGEDDWLAQHPEAGQSLEAHRADCVPVIGRAVYLVPAGLTAQGQRTLDRVAPLLAAYFQLPVKTLPALPEAVAGKTVRQRPSGPQWLTRDVLDALLERRPADAAAVMAITDVDLYPDPAWNFVFGEASYEQRVGVMSLARTGDALAEPQQVLERTYATGVHEIGHMLQLAHCVAWECPMNGTNHQEEADSRPLEPCPHCLAKLMRATGLDPKKRWAELRAAFAEAGLTRGVKEIDRELQAR